MYAYIKLLDNDYLNAQEHKMNTLIDGALVATTYKIKSTSLMLITSLIISIACIESAYAKLIEIDQRILGDCAVQVFSYHEETPNPPNLDQTGHYCNCLFSYDEKTEKPFTIDTITVEHIDQCKAKFLGIKETEPETK